MKARLIVAVALVLLLPWAAMSQQQKPQTSAPTVVLEYFENASGNLAIYDASRKSVSFDIGTRVLPGWTVVTDRGDLAELRLEPNGSIIKISQMTNFKVDSLQSSGDDSNTFSVAIGKIRAVAGKATGKERYSIRGLSAVCGVRGTDFGMEVGADSETAFVLDGLVDYTKLSTGETIQIAKGMMADALGKLFQPMQIPQAFMDGIQRDLNFRKLDPKNVPGHELTQAPAANEEPAAEGDKGQPAEETKGTETANTGVAPAGTVVPAPAAEKPEGGEKPEAGQPAKPGPLDGVLGWLRDILGMQIGSITIDSVTYSKLVFAPEFAIGKIKMGLYLPLIYTTNMFDPATWYKPAGNNEWDFGFTGGPWDPINALEDLVLKIKYIEWGKQRDPFFLKVGNLDDITIGHGLIMSNFANDADFPVIRRVGLNVGFDLGFMGLEAMVNDAAMPEIMGGRIFFRPIPKLKAAIGLTLLADLNPDKALESVYFPSTTILMSSGLGDPIFFNPGLDLDIPIVETDPFAIIAYADVAGMVPWLRTGIPATSVGPGLHLETLWSSGPKNYGAAAGVMGNIFVADYRVEFRYFKGFFQPNFYNNLYELTSRTAQVLATTAYLLDPANPTYDVTTLGVYGEGGFTWPKVCSLKLGYFWPWTIDSTGAMKTGDNDHLLLTFVLEKGVIPVVNLSGSVSYERTMFVPMLLNKSATLSLFDANTAVNATLVYSINPNLDVQVTYTWTAALDQNGNLIYESEDSLLPEMNSAFAIETSMHF